MKLPLSRIAEYLEIPDQEVGAGDLEAIVTGYSIDSRTIKKGELFFAVKGEKFDGHDFVAQACERGAVAAVVSKEKFSEATNRVGASGAARHVLLPVEDTLRALQTLAQSVRRLWARPLIGITGSVGKTTTKEAIAHLLSTRYRVLKSEGNFNNHFGLPLMLLKLEPEHDVAVIEMGMSHLGEIRALAAIAQPEMGVVTCVAPVHLEFFDSLAGIARAKYELVESLPPGGTAVLNADDEYVSRFGRDFRGKVVTFGVKTSADVRAENIQAHGEAGSTFDVIAGGCRETVTSPLVGKHNVYNMLAAVAVALERGLSPSEAGAALASLSASDKRGQVIQVGDTTVIND